MKLTHSPADVLRYALISLSAGTLPENAGSWPIFVDREPDLPDNCITLYNTAGRMQGRIQYTGRMVEFPGIQIRIRSTSHGVGHTRSELLREKLDEVILNTNVTISASEYEIGAATRQGTILYLGTDVSQSKRHLFTINLILSLTQTN